MKLFLSFLSIFIFFNCKTQNLETPKPLNKNTHTLEMPENYKLLNNDDQSLVLFYKIEQTNSDPAKHFTYYVQRVSDGTKIYQGEYRGENIGWYNHNSLALTPYVGIIQKPDSYIEEDEIKEANQNPNIQILKID